MEAMVSLFDGLEQRRKVCRGKVFFNLCSMIPAAGSKPMSARAMFVRMASPRPRSAEEVKAVLNNLTDNYGLVERLNSGVACRYRYAAAPELSRQ